MDENTRKSLRREILDDIKKEISSKDIDINTFGKLVELIIDECVSGNNANVETLANNVMRSQSYISLSEIYPDFNRSFIRGYVWRIKDVLGEIKFENFYEYTDGSA